MVSFITALIAYVVVPVAGIVWFDWDWRSVLLLYWLENVTAGVRNVISMARAPQLHDPNRPPVRTEGFSGRVGFILFFIMHYGIFTLVHGVFVFVICSGLFPVFGASRPTIGDIAWGSLLLVWAVGSAVQIVMTCLEPRDELPAVSSQFMRPYGRIFALHITVIAGVWLINAMDWPPAAAILLVVLHFLIDLVQLRRRPASRPMYSPS